MELLCIHLHLQRYHRHHPEVLGLPQVQDLPEVIHQEGFDQKILRSHSHKSTLVTKVDFIQKNFQSYECLFVLKCIQNSDYRIQMSFALIDVNILRKFTTVLCHRYFEYTLAIRSSGSLISHPHCL